jgi:thymidine kinase
MLPAITAWAIRLRCQRWEFSVHGQDRRHFGADMGRLEVICGPMFSGKTEELIRRLRRAQIARQKVVVFKPRIDDRYDAVNVVSHSAQRLESMPVADTEEMRRKLEAQGEPVHVVGVDEAQFFDHTLLELVEELADAGVRVVVAGLDADYLGKPFGPIPQLLAVAEIITKQLAVCVVCGAPASRSQRVHPQAVGGTVESDQVLVGAQDAYEARCRRCYVRGVDVPFVAHTRSA